MCLKWRWFPSVSVTRRQAVSWCLQSPAQPAAVCSTAALGPQTAVVCSAAVRGGDRAPQSLSPQLTKMCHFIIISGCQQCSLAPTLALCISAPEFGDLAHKNHPQPGPGSRSFAFTQRSSVAKTQTSLSLTRNSDECSRHFIAFST